MRFFVIHRHESVTSIHVSPHPAIPFSPLSTPYPPGLSQSTSFGALLHVSNLHWSSVLHMVMYMFQCYSLKSPHSCLLPLSPKVCSLHPCLFCCLAQVLNIDLQKWIPGLVKPHIYTVLVVTKRNEMTE